MAGTGESAKAGNVCHLSPGGNECQVAVIRSEKRQMFSLLRKKSDYNQTGGAVHVSHLQVFCEEKGNPSNSQSRGQMLA